MRMITASSTIAFIVSTISLVCLAAPAKGEVFCKKKVGGAVLLKSKCSKGEKLVNLSAFGILGQQGIQGEQGPAGPQGVQGPAGPQGIQGFQGASGVDGSLRIYGDGSAGAVTISSPTDWSSTPPAGNNYQFTDLTISSGAVLTVSSGTTIRCTGTFTNNGTIIVKTGAQGVELGMTYPIGDIMASPAITVPEAGVSLRAAQSGESGIKNKVGGKGGIGLSKSSAAFILKPGIKAGGAGAGSVVSGGNGGGSLVILAQTAIANRSISGGGGVIYANGSDGLSCAGGGAGGVVVLASPGIIDNTSGVISVKGGNGGIIAYGSGYACGNGGGGGGGIVHFISKSVSIGTVEIDGGAGASLASNLSTSFRQAGAGGGACGGNGGNGGDIDYGNNPSAGGAGGSGHRIQSSVDPTALF